MKRQYQHLAEFANGLSAGQEWAVDLLEELGEAELSAAVSKEDLEWIQAAYHYDHGDPLILAGMMRRSESIPRYAVELLVEIVKGDRKPDAKSIAQMKGDASLRWIYIITTIMFGKGLDIVRRSTVKIGGELGVEPEQVRQVTTLVNDSVRRAAMQRLEIKERTLDELLKNFRNRLKNFPKL